jgi:hypothetical protein
MVQIPSTSVAMTLIGFFLAATAGSAFAAHNYVVANNNTFPTNTVSVYELSGTSLIGVTTVPTGGAGTGSGYPANTTQSVAHVPLGNCVFAGDAASGDISAMQVVDKSPYLQVVRNYYSSDGDAATEDGLGLIVSGDWLYANYTGNGSNIPPAIGVWQMDQGCGLALVDHLATSGMNGGPIDGMAAVPFTDFLIVAYGDGSVGSYSIGGDTIHFIGQEMIAGNGVGAGAYAGSVAISANGKWAIFGDFSPSNTTQIDVASIGSNGVLGPTTTYGGTGSLGNGINTNGIALSPDNRFIYVVDGGSGQETTLSFDETTGVVTYPNNCLTDLRNYNTSWATASQVAVEGDRGTGSGLYISEGFLTGDSYIALLKVNSETGCTSEAPKSPFADPNGGSLQSITSVTF